ncbi:MAG: IPTL-CTERM sorting domain-containing protein [Phycisphaerae bacterium]
MNRAKRSGDLGWLITASLLPVCLAAARTTAIEVTVQNDSLAVGELGSVQAGFVAGESAATWLTSPCDGNIVGVQVFWRSLTGTAPLSIEDSIKIFEAGTHPTPGALLETIGGPVMTDGVLNEFRYLDENQTIPLIVPVSSGQGFVVSFKFLNTPNPTEGPSVVTDADGCQFGKNGLDEITFGWLDPCLLGVSGDFVIRTIVECGEVPGACCEIGGDCADGVNETDCTSAGGVFHGEGTDCADVTCEEACCFLPTGCLDLTVPDCDVASGFNQGPGTTCATAVCFPTGACCDRDGTCADGVLDSECEGLGGTFQGDGTLCSELTCPQPDGACCLSNGNCLVLTEADCGVIPDASWPAAFTDCTDDDENGTADACESPLDIPTVSEWGIVSMALLMITAGTVVLVRRRGVAVAGTVS